MSKVRVVLPDGTERVENAYDAFGLRRVIGGGPTLDPAPARARRRRPGEVPPKRTSTKRSKGKRAKATTPPTLAPWADAAPVGPAAPDAPRAARRRRGRCVWTDWRDRRCTETARAGFTTCREHAAADLGELAG